MKIVYILGGIPILFFLVVYVLPVLLSVAGVLIGPIMICCALFIIFKIVQSVFS